MITSRHPVSATDIARHYDEFDRPYREIWGEHLHHGLWDDDSGDASVESATIRLLEHLTAPLHPRAGHHYADIGSGYGATARWLANNHQLHVTALTLSPRQAEWARRAPLPPTGSVDYQVADWLHNSLPDDSLHGALAVEVLAHVADKPQFFRQLRRTLKPGARCAVADWTVADDLHAPERALLRHLCRDGCLAGIGTLGDYRRLADGAGLGTVTASDVTIGVERTWRVILRRGIGRAVTRPHTLGFLFRRLLRGRLTFLAIPALLLAYRTGALRYSLVTLERPADSIARPRNDG